MDGVAGPESLCAQRVRIAVDHAFAEAAACLAACGALVPFSIACMPDAYDVTDHAGSSPAEIYRSLRGHIARAMPDAYVFVYDGFIDTETGGSAALVCEVVCQGDGEGRLLVLPYRAEGAYVFAGSYAVAGTVPSRYPVRAACAAGV